MSGVACDAMAHARFGILTNSATSPSGRVESSQSVLLPMNLRLKRTASVAAASLVALAAYHVAAVPLIEPTFPDSSSDTSSAPPFVDQPSRSLAAYLPPGSWELDNPTKIESDRSKLLFKEYRNLPSGNEVELKPCAIVFFPNGEAAEAPSQRVIVLEAPLAVLKFDGPVDLQKMKLGQLQSGTMSGPIAIHGTPSRPGANDEIFADTQGTCSFRRN